MGHFGSFPLYYETSSDETSFSTHVDPCWHFSTLTPPWIWYVTHGCTEKSDWWKRVFSLFNAARPVQRIFFFCFMVGRYCSFSYHYPISLNRTFRITLLVNSCFDYWNRETKSASAYQGHLSIFIREISDRCISAIAICSLEIRELSSSL